MDTKDSPVPSPTPTPSIEAPLHSSIADLQPITASMNKDELFAKVEAGEVLEEETVIADENTTKDDTIPEKRMKLDEEDGDKSMTREDKGTAEPRRTEFDVNLHETDEEDQVIPSIATQNSLGSDNCPKQNVDSSMRGTDGENQVIPSIATQDSFESEFYPKRTREDVVKQEEAIRRRREEEKANAISSIANEMECTRNEMNESGELIQKDFQLAMQEILKLENELFERKNNINRVIRTHKLAFRGNEARFQQLAVKHGDLRGKLLEIDPSNSSRAILFPSVVKQVEKAQFSRYKIVKDDFAM